jgi:uncharacterized SAM-binding protein YcdF (DUF218 family)
MSSSRRIPHPLRRASSGGVLLRLISWALLLLVLFAIYLLRAPILRAVGSVWIVDEPVESADAIVLLGDDNYPAQRASRAAELYHERRAPVIVACGRFLRPYVSIADLMQKDLTDRGVPAAAILRLASFARNTREEAVVVRRTAEQRRWKRIIVVTSNYHTRRTRYIYRRVMRGAAEFRVVAARDSEYLPENWWQTRTGWKRFVYELGGFVVAAWETRSTEAALEFPADLQPLSAPAPQPIPVR